MLVKTKAIVFSAIKFGEADLIVSCFTQQEGIKSYLLRNILKSRKSTLKASYFQPLTQLNLIASHKNKGTLEYLRDVKIDVHYRTLHTDIVKSSLVMFLSEILKSCIREEEANPQLYQFISGSLIWLDKNKEAANFHIFFLLELSRFLGVFPDISDLNDSYFNLMEGKFEAHQTEPYSLPEETSSQLKLFLNKNPDEIKSIILSRQERANILNAILTYYQLHVQGYKKPKSLEVFSQLFA